MSAIKSITNYLHSLSKKDLWTIMRTLLFIVIGILNTVLIRQQEIGTWKNYLGYLLLTVGVIELAIFLIKMLNRFNQTKTQRDENL
jgi:hypothetical protein